MRCEHVATTPALQNNHLMVRSASSRVSNHGPRSTPSQRLVVAAVAVALRRGDVAILGVVILNRRGGGYRLRRPAAFGRRRVGLNRVSLGTGSTHGVPFCPDG